MRYFMSNFEKVEWSDSYSVGIESVDKQHKKLVEIINNLYDLINSSQKVYETGYQRIFDELLKYTEYHFSYEEEEFIDRYNYPSADIHKATHKSFIRSIQDRIAQADVATPENGKVLYKYLSTWLLNHISKADNAWGKFVADARRNGERLII